MPTLYLCGAGNSEGVRLALNLNKGRSRWDRIVLLDDDPVKHGRLILGVEIAGAFEALARADANSDQVANLVARTTAKRLAAHRRIEAYGLPFVALIDVSVDTGGTELAHDVIMYPNATIGPEASVDDGSVVFMGAAVGHESRIGRCCVVAPHAVINARVELDEGVYVGCNATILPDVRVGAWATIGAGSVAMQNVPAGATVMGVPARAVLTADAKRRMPKSEPAAELPRSDSRRPGR